jgi:hypothetical protein
MTEDNSPLSDVTPKVFCITCQEPGCTNHIKYSRDDVEVPLYCERHRTKEGRHSRVRVLKSPEKKIEEEPIVVMRCINATCHHRIPVLKSDWMRNGVAIKLLCPKCGGKMIYHKESQPTAAGGVR